MKPVSNEPHMWQTIRLGLYFGIGLALAALSVFIVIIVVLYHVNESDFAVDDSDKNGWERSGLKTHVDHRSGQEYLSSPNGGIIKREPAK